ncbi:MAG: FkbM family methyltransferase [bacterium]|nr:MAG: FkbM family methyltransferase [bacterium]
MARSILVKLGDPSCKMKIRGRSIYLPISHPLAFNVSQHPHYDGVIERVSEFIRSREGRLIYIDVGANIGDTILFSNPQENDRVLGIDADDIYLDYLKKNVGHLRGVTLIQTICSSKDGQINGSLHRNQGTARIVENIQNHIRAQSLDTILTNNSDFKSVNFLKVDTDGYDFEVLKGAKKTILRNKPAVLFECEPNENPDYVKEMQNILKFFHENGYRSALLYDNFGYLYGRLELDDVFKFKNALFYQLTRVYYYYDILLMPEEQLQAFYSSEINFFVNQIKSDSDRLAAQQAVRLED